MKRSPNALESDTTIINEHLVNNISRLLQTDLLPQLTASICRAHEYQPENIKNDIRTLSKTNKFFHNHYAQKKVKQEIIDLCLPHHNSNTKEIAHKLGCHAIYKEIDRLTNIVSDSECRKNDFSQTDLLDPWYLAATTTSIRQFDTNEKPFNQSLLYIAVDNWHFKKAISILKNTKELYFNYGNQQNPLLTAVYDHTRFLRYPEHKEIHETLLTIIRSLLQKKINPNGRETDTQDLPLFCAVEHADEKLTRLLLEYDADPYLTQYNTAENKTLNAFDVEPEQTWLQKIIDEVNAEKKLKTVPAPTDQSEQK